MSYKGIDISRHNGYIDFNQVKKQVDFVIIRASYGFFNKDDMFDNNVNGCEANGIPYGLYHYSYARNLEEAEKEVNGFLQLAKSCRPTYPLIIDMEDADNWKLNNGNPSNNIYISICNLFCQKLEEAGYYAMIYANKDWFTNRINSSTLNRFDKWLAHWGISEPSMTCGIWQYTSSGKINGINGFVDLDIAYKDYPSIIKNMNNSSSENNSNNESNSNNYNEYYQAFNSTSIVDGLKSIGVDSSFNYRCEIAKANGINNYTGSYNENVTLLELARNGKLKIANVSTKYFKYFDNTSIVDGLKSIGVDSSFSYRIKIANKNGISMYVGSPSQNMYLLELARNGKLLIP